jgi:hypothetical protein
MMADFGFLLISGNPALSFGKGSVGTSTLKTIFMKKIKIIFILFLIFNSSLFFSQNEFSKWYFGQFAGLDFSTSPPTILTNGGTSSNGGATICDNTGNLLFYSNGGNAIFNNTHSVMANGNGLAGIAGTQPLVAVKQPGNNTLYYVFTLDQGGGINGAKYSIVDMALAAGLGSVTIKNATLYTPSCEKQVAVRHCNGRDVWIVSHEYNSNKFRSYLLTSIGLNPTPVITAIGETPGQGNSNNSLMSTAGDMKITPDGKKLALAVYGASVPSTLGLGGFQLFDFDASTGVISNSLILLNAPNAIGSPFSVEFSSDGTKLYGVGQPSLNNIPAILYQWDICSQFTTAIIASQYSLNLGAGFVFGALQRAINNKIYMAVGGTQNLHVINNPNASGVAMGFTLNGQSLAPTSTCYSGLPNYINYYVKPNYSLVPLTNTIACQKVNFVVPVTTFSSGCSSTPYPPSGYLWDFGEASSGAANTSTLSNPVHTYSALGTYTVQLILFNNCTNDTLKKVINITTLGPTPAVSGPSVICRGEKYVYTASGGSTYLWANNNATTATQTLAPTTTTSYTVSATTNGCTLSKTFTVTVNPCTGIEAYQNNGLWQVFPNPFKDVLSIEAALVPTSGGAANTSKVLRLVNVLGEELISVYFENKIDLDMTNLSKGIYFVQLLDKNKVLFSKKVIKE